MHPSSDNTTPTAPRQEPPQEGEPSRKHTGFSDKPTPPDKWIVERAAANLCNFIMVPTSNPLFQQAVVEINEVLRRHAPPPAASVEQPELRALLQEVDDALESDAPLLALQQKIRRALSRSSSGEPAGELAALSESVAFFSTEATNMRVERDRLAKELAGCRESIAHLEEHKTRMRAQIAQLKSGGEQASVGVGRLSIADAMRDALNCDISAWLATAVVPTKQDFRLHNLAELVERLTGVSYSLSGAELAKVGPTDTQRLDWLAVDPHKRLLSVESDLSTIRPNPRKLDPLRQAIDAAMTSPTAPACNSTPQTPGNTERE